MVMQFIYFEEEVEYIYHINLVLFLCIKDTRVICNKVIRHEFDQFDDAIENMALSLKGKSFIKGITRNCIHVCTYFYWSMMPIKYNHWHDNFVSE